LDGGKGIKQIRKDNKRVEGEKRKRKEQSFPFPFWGLSFSIVN
jgi:hypothetical protein